MYNLCDLWSQYIQVRKLFKGENYSRVETIRKNKVTPLFGDGHGYMPPWLKSKTKKGWKLIALTVWSGRANGADLLSGEAPNGNSCFYCCCKMNLLVLCCCCCSEGSTLMANYPTSYTIIASSFQFSGNSTSTDHPKWFIQYVFLLSFCYHHSFIIVILQCSLCIKSTSKLHASISDKQFLGLRFTYE